MLGAVIGDLAAYTWQKDKDVFYKQLISEKVKMSEFGLMAFQMAPLVFSHKDSDNTNLVQALKSVLRTEYGGRTLYSHLEYMYRPGQYDWYFIHAQLVLILIGLCGWSNQDPIKACEQARKICSEFALEKDGFYASLILPELICNLRNGKSKDEALKGIEEGARDIFLHWNKGEDDILGAIARAWDAFYRSFDFTSALHSAVISPVNPHLTATIAGMLADAMYSCEQGFLKQKYTKDTAFYIDCPHKEWVDGWYELRKLKESVRLFFPKNRALTNVERHSWTPIFNPFKDVPFDDELLQKIRMADDTGRENRYGIYLDNGWYYIYRSHYSLYRFRINKKGDNYVIEDMQRSEDPHAKNGVGLIDAFYSIECPPYGSNENRKPYLINSPGCKYYLNKLPE